MHTRPWVRKNINTNTDGITSSNSLLSLDFTLLHRSTRTHCSYLLSSPFLFFFFLIVSYFQLFSFTFISVFFECINQPVGIIINVLSFFSTFSLQGHPSIPFKFPPHPLITSSLSLPFLDCLLFTSLPNLIRIQIPHTLSDEL
jgi:hypothetical protein